jgi:hypothetical protein
MVITLACLMQTVIAIVWPMIRQSNILSMNVY